MTRAPIAVTSALLSVATGAGAWATMSTTHLGAEASKPDTAVASAIRKQQRQLDRWEESLDDSLAARPPALPRVPRYAPVALVQAPAAAALPTLDTSPLRIAGAAVQPAAEPVAEPPSVTPIDRPEPTGEVKEPSPVPARTRREPAEQQAARATAPAGPARGRTQPAPPAPPVVVAVPAPPPVATEPPTEERHDGDAGDHEHRDGERGEGAAPPPPAAPEATPTTTPVLTTEAQCEALKRAAESQGEAAKKAAERQCEQAKGGGER